MKNEEAAEIKKVLRELRSSKPIGFVIGRQLQDINWIPDALMEPIRELLIADLSEELQRIQMEKGHFPDSYVKSFS